MGSFWDKLAIRLHQVFYRDRFIGGQRAAADLLLILLLAAALAFLLEHF